MLSNYQKRLIVITVDMLFSAFIWYVNASWGNAFITCLILSTTTFLIVLVPYEVYASFRSIWFDRWTPLSLRCLEISKVKIQVQDGFLHADLMKYEDSRKTNSKPVVIISHGFSDTRKTLQYLYIPLAFQGFVILAYDSRGTGESKKTGKRSQFLERINDFNKIIEWIGNHEYLKKKKIYCIGVSIGGTITLSAGFPNKNIKKIVAISALSHYKENMSKLHPIARFSYLMKGVNLNPNEEENQKLSPHSIIEKNKKDLVPEEWKNLSKRVLLIHAKNDKVIKFKNFQQNASILELSTRNQLVFSKGGHSNKKNELAILGAILRFFNE